MSRRRRAALWLRATMSLATLSPSPLLHAVSPLTTDDAETVEPGRLQLNGCWQFSRAASTRLHTLPLNPVLGLGTRGEVGATFSYLARDGFGAAPGQDDANGVTDLTLATKWRLWQAPDGSLKLSGRLDLKLPTASERRCLGTGNADVSAVLIATRCWGATCLDWNIGYTVIDASRSTFGDDIWFLGQAVRRELNDRWALIGEAYGLVPSEGTSAKFNFNGGAQFKAHESFLVSALIGSAAGRNSPDLTGFLGFTWDF